jgi:hypothetical protein
MNLKFYRSIIKEIINNIFNLLRYYILYLFTNLEIKTNIIEVYNDTNKLDINVLTNAVYKIFEYKYLLSIDLHFYNECKSIELVKSTELIFDSNDLINKINNLNMCTDIVFKYDEYRYILDDNSTEICKYNVLFNLYDEYLKYDIDLIKQISKLHLDYLNEQKNKLHNDNKSDNFSQEFFNKVVDIESLIYTISRKVEKLS